MPADCLVGVKLAAGASAAVEQISFRYADEHTGNRFPMTVLRRMQRLPDGTISYREGALHQNLRDRRRGYRIKHSIGFVAVHESGGGTSRSSGDVRLESAK